MIPGITAGQRTAPPTDFLFPSLVTNTNTFFSPTLIHVLRPPLFTNTNTFFAPTVSQPFLPIDLGSSVLKAWWDASNAGSITSSGGTVSQWDDLSGNANHIAQSVSGSRPTTGSVTINSMNALGFDGTDDDLQKTTGVSLSSNDGTTILAVRKHNSGTSGGILMGLRTLSSNDVCKMGRDAGNFVAGGNGTSNSSSTQASVADSDNTNPILWSATYKVSPSRREIFKDGTSVATNTTAISSQAAPDAIYVGRMFRADRAVNLYGNMNLAEVLWLSGDGATNRQKCEGYLAWKWGLVSALDAGHPYKSAPPTT